MKTLNQNGLDHELSAHLIQKLNDLLAELNDEGTNALASDYIRAQEKLVWMYSAFLNRK